MSEQKPPVKKSIFPRHTLRYVVTLSLLGLAVHLILPQIATLEHSYQVLQDMIWWAVGLAFAAQVISYVGSGYVIAALVKITGSRITVFWGSIITLASNSLGMVAGGVLGSAAAVYKWMHDEHVRPEAATLAGTIPGLFDDLALLMFSVLGLIHLLILHQLSKLQVISFSFLLSMLVSFVVLLVWGLRKRDALTRLVDRVGGRWAAIRRRTYNKKKTAIRLNGLFSAADLLLKGGWQNPLLGSVINVFFDMLTLYLLFVAAGHRVSVGALVSGYGISLLLGKLAFVLPGGIGVIESTMTGLFVGFGVPTPVTVVVVLAYRFFSLWVPLITGFPIIVYLQHRTTGPEPTTSG